MTNIRHASLRGGTGILAQSGAFGNWFLPLPGSTGLAGLDKFVSIGNVADVAMAEMLSFWKDDESTRVIGIHCEGLSRSGPGGAYGS